MRRGKLGAGDSDRGRSAPYRLRIPGFTAEIEIGLGEW